MGKVLGGRPPDDVEVYAATLAQPSQMRASTLLYRQFLTREVRRCSPVATPGSA